jgi:hypothetical protein
MNIRRLTSPPAATSTGTGAPTRDWSVHAFERRSLRRHPPMPASAVPRTWTWLPPRRATTPPPLSRQPTKPRGYTRRAWARCGGRCVLCGGLPEIYLCNVCSCQETLRRSGRGQPEQPINLAELSLVVPAWEALPLGCAPTAQRPRLLWWAICELACAGNR